MPHCLQSFGLNYSLHAPFNSYLYPQVSQRSTVTNCTPAPSMDSNLPQSKSVPSNLTTGRRHRVSISVSGSYQSHLSNLGYLHRVRTASEQISLGSIGLEKDYLHILEGGLAEQRPRVGRFYLLKQFVTDPATFLSDDLRRIRNGHVWRPRTLLTLYCCFSVLFLSLKIHTFVREALQVAQPQQHQSWGSVTNLAEADLHGASLPPLMNVTLSQRLSVAFRELSQAHLDTFAVQAHPSSKSDLTACLWIEDARIEEAFASATTWPGPVSLIVVTTNAPNSTVYKNLLGHLTAKCASSNTSVHVLHVSSVVGGSSNAYLNMARFFARTSQVVLFPDGIPKLDHALWLDKLPVDISYPVLLSNSTHRSFSPRLLAPVLLPRDHPVWCAERFYMFGSRILDWEDCLWKLWLESAGEASSIAVPHFLDGSENTTALSVSPYAVRLSHSFIQSQRISAVCR